MWLDLRASARTFLREPAFTSVLVLTLALGIGSATAIFSVADAVMLRRLPFHEPERLYRVLSRNSYPDMLDWMANADSFETFGGYNAWSVDLQLGDEPEKQNAAIVTGDLLPMLGVAPSRGRLLAPRDDVEGGAGVVLVSHDFWQRRLDGADAAVGASLSVNGQPYSVIGVAAEDFRLPGVEADLFFPIRVVQPESAAARGVHFLISVGRLRPDVGVEAAQADLDAVAARLEELYPDENTGRRFVLEPWRRQLAAESRPALVLLLGFVGLLLLIACANAAGLLLARSARRRPEMALRSALGAGSRRILRLHVTEAISLAIVSGLVGTLLARGLVGIFLALAPEDIPRLAEVGVDGRVLGFALALAALTGALFGIAPALRALQAPLAPAFSTASSRVTFSSARLRSVLIVVEVAMAVVLLVGTGLLLRSFHRLTNVEPGFRSESVLTMYFNLPLPEYRDIGKRIAFFESVLERVSILPGVDGVAATTDLPFGEGSIAHNLALEGRPLPEGTEPEINYRGVSAEYFRVMGIPIVEGRSLTTADRSDSQPVAVVNEAFARALLDGGSPIGQRFRWARRDEVRWITVVGVAGDVKPGALDASEVPAVYVPFLQERMWWRSWMSVVARTSVAPETIVNPARRAVAELSRSIPVANIETMTTLLSRSLHDRRFHLALLGSFAAAAVALAAIGLYALLSYLVAERRQELGVRLALGASRASLLAIVLRLGGRLTAFGLLAGTALALVSTRLVESFLFDVGSRDPLTFAAIGLVVAAVSVVASLVPAYRASRVDPLTLIRQE